jgi:4-hydroxybenzoate polyprenyltransferase
MRPSQWVKNAFLFAPLVFSKHLFDEAYVLQALLAFGVFSLLSSLVYVVNDWADIEADRMHPIKRNRPLAAGTLSKAGAAILIALLISLSIAGAVIIGGLFWVAAGMYFGLNLGYSLGLKKVILLDVFIIAAGFMLRVLAGAFAIQVQASPWLIMCTLFVAVFLAVSKRKAEIMLNITQETEMARPVLRKYDLQFIDQMMIIAASGMAISYALYTVASRTVEVFGTENLMFTTVFVLFGIFRYLHLMRVFKTNDNPTHLLLTDAAMILNVIAWLFSCVFIIYYHRIKDYIVSL